MNIKFAKREFIDEGWSRRHYSVAEYFAGYRYISRCARSVRKIRFEAQREIPTDTDRKIRHGRIVSSNIRGDIFVRRIKKNPNARLCAARGIRLRLCIFSRSAFTLFPFAASPAIPPVLPLPSPRSVPAREIFLLSSVNRSDRHPTFLNRKR